MRVIGSLSLDNIALYLSQDVFDFFIFTVKNNKKKDIHISLYQNTPLVYEYNKNYRGLFIVVNYDEVISLGELYDRKYKQGHIFYDEELLEQFARSRS